MEAVAGSALCQDPSGRTLWKGLTVVLGGRAHGLRGTGVLAPGSKLSGCPWPGPVLCGLWGLILGEQVI